MISISNCCGCQLSSSRHLIGTKAVRHWFSCKKWLSVALSKVLFERHRLLFRRCLFIQGTNVSCLRDPKSAFLRVHIDFDIPHSFWELLTGKTETTFRVSCERHLYNSLSQTVNKMIYQHFLDPSPTAAYSIQPELNQAPYTCN